MLNWTIFKVCLSHWSDKTWWNIIFACINCLLNQFVIVLIGFNL